MSSIPCGAGKQAPPSTEELTEFWEQLPPLSQNEDGRAWFHSITGMDEDVAAPFLARLALWGDPVRVIPSGLTCPQWAAWSRGSWSAAPWRIVFPRYDAKGQLCAFQLRDIAFQQKTKSMSPSNAIYNWLRQGTVVVNSIGVELLRGGQPDVSHPVVLTEGETDFMAILVNYKPDQADAPALFGFLGGGETGTWSEALSIAVASPDRLFLIDPDEDRAGDGYHDAIAISLHMHGAHRLVPRVRYAE